MVDQALHLRHYDLKKYPETREELKDALSRIVESRPARDLNLTLTQAMAAKWEHLHELIANEEEAIPLAEEARQFVNRSEYAKRVLEALRDGPKPRKELRAIVGGDSNLSQVLARMEARGLIARTPGADGRSVDVAMGVIGVDLLAPRPVLPSLHAGAVLERSVTLHDLRAA